MTEQAIRFVLCRPTHPGNVGAVARAIKTMGFDRLVLVAPACEIDGVARARASGALDVLQAARIVADLPAAVGDCGFVIGASARRRRLRWPEYAPGEAAREAVAASHAAPVAVVFGSERAGLTNAELDLCSALVHIPSNPEYSSLNLAMAAQIIAYEIRLAQCGDGQPQKREVPARARDVELFYAHLERALIASGFLKPDNPRSLMRRLRRLFNRARLDEHEVNILRGILTSLAPGSGDSPRADREAARAEEDEQ